MEDEMREYVEPETTMDEFLLEDDSVERERKNIKKSLGMPNEEQDSGLNLEDYFKRNLYKAGMDLQIQEFVNTLYYIGLILNTVIVFSVASFLLANYGWITVFVVTCLLWFVSSLVVAGILLISASFYLNYKIFKRKKEVERSLPEFLRLVASNIRSGLPLHEAIDVSAKKRFGILAREVSLVAKASRVKDDFAQSLKIFGKKFDSDILNKSMNSIAASVKSGADISGLLEKTADNIVKMKNMRLKMAASVKNYIVFIIVAGVIIAPMMFSMSYHLNNTIGDIQERVDVGRDSGLSGAGDSLNIEGGGGVESDDFDLFAILMILTNVVVSAFLISIIRYGNWRQGIRRIPLYLILSTGIYYGGKLLFSGFLGII